MLAKSWPMDDCDPSRERALTLVFHAEDIPPALDVSTARLMPSSIPSSVRSHEPQPYRGHPYYGAMAAFHDATGNKLSEEWQYCSVCRHRPVG